MKGVRRLRTQLKGFIHHRYLHCLHWPTDCIWKQITETRGLLQSTFSEGAHPTSLCNIFLLLLVQESRQQLSSLTPASTAHQDCKIHLLPCLHFFPERELAFLVVSPASAPNASPEPGQLEPFPTENRHILPGSGSGEWPPFPRAGRGCNNEGLSLKSFFRGTHKHKTF